MIIQCPTCSIEIEVTEALIGAKGQCPGCGDKFIVPGSGAPSSEQSEGLSSKSEVPSGQKPEARTPARKLIKTSVARGRRLARSTQPRRGGAGVALAIVAICGALAVYFFVLDGGGDDQGANGPGNQPVTELAASESQPQPDVEVDVPKLKPVEPEPMPVTAVKSPKPKQIAPEPAPIPKRVERKPIRRINKGVTVAALTADQVSEYENEIKPLLQDFCFDCHGDGSSKGDFAMDDYGSLSDHFDDLGHWLPLWENIRSQIMPPSDKDQLSIDEKKRLMEWIQHRIFQLDPQHPDPGRVTIRRLNRTEYRNAVYDLLGVEFNTAEFFPPDDTGYGFDNIGDVLSISPLLMEKYIAAAEEVVLKALPKGKGAQVPVQMIAGKVFRDPDKEINNGRWLPFNDRATVRTAPTIRWDGQYEVTVEYQIRGAIEATDQEAKLKVTCATETLGEETLGWDQRDVIELRGVVNLKKGRPLFKISMSPSKAPADDQEEQAVTIKRVIIRGPLSGKHREYSKGHQMIFVEGEPKGDPKTRQAYAGRIMRSFVSRAFRRPIKRGTVDRLVAIVKEIDSQPGKAFEDGIREAIATCLCSPRFLFRIEIQPEPNNPGKIVSLDEYALASRLSFFLWGSVPDDELLSLAFNKKLRKTLPAQVDRMLADPRSERLVQNFVGQWLQTRDVATTPLAPHVILDVEDRRDAAKLFDVRLLDDMGKETEMFFDFILRNDRPVEEIIAARYSFLNERLAKFYGISGVTGEGFVKVDLSKHPERGGVLTQGSYLIISSNPTRTSPVKRGLFVLDNFLGTPAPPPPPNTPELEDAAEQAGPNPTMREMMQIHRENPDCRGCHARMDPIGLGLENFDALGRFRSKENGKPIDAAGELLTGEKFTDVAQLKQILAYGRRDDFYRCLSEKLLTYAIGRGVEYYDAPTIDQLVDRLKKNNGKLRELIMGIIESAPFQQRRGSE
ncbi:MAG: hypothetical protein ACI9UA_002084 [Pseudoalteromonas tetraodonis]|jgi:hypothetical protein